MSKGGAGKYLFRAANVCWRCAQYFVFASCGKMHRDNRCMYMAHVCFYVLLSFMEIPHVHLIICMSALSNIHSTSTSKGLVSLPEVILLLTQLTYTRPLQQGSSGCSEIAKALGTSSIHLGRQNFSPH